MHVPMAAAAPPLCSLGLGLQWGRRREPQAPALTPAQRLQTHLRPLRLSAQDAVKTLTGMPANLQAAIDNLRPEPQLTGRWHKDTEASDSMQDAIEMVDLAWYLRPAVAVLKTLEVPHTSCRGVAGAAGGSGPSPNQLHPQANHAPAPAD